MFPSKSSGQICGRSISPPVFAKFRTAALLARPKGSFEDDDEDDEADLEYADDEEEEEEEDEDGTCATILRHSFHLIHLN